jgi:proton-translocating NADH-quinone oxidoreductase chain M
MRYNLFFNIFMIILINFLILIGLIILLFIPATKTIQLKNYSLTLSFLVFIGSLSFLKIPLAVSIYAETASITILSLPSFIFASSYILDGLSVIFLVLTTFLIVIVVLSARSIKYRLKEKYFLLFFLEFLLINCFITSEILFFYLFFETILIPVFLIIGIWGSQKNKIFAANQFFLYTLFGSFFLLVGIVILFILTGTSNIFLLKSVIFTPNIEKILFLLFFISFAIKIPMFPVHLWLPKAHVEAPTVGSVLLAGILLKLGSYGFLRFSLFLFPAAGLFFAPLILTIVVLSITFSSITVLRQIDLKRIVAYSSIAHMNYLVGALFVNNLLALTGSLLLQIAHGLSSSALFLCVGFLYDRYQSRNIFYYRGLVTILPFFCFFFFVFNLANLGFPSTVNFLAEMLIFFGLFSSLPSIAMLTLIGIFLSAVYSFVLITRVCFGPATAYITSFYDLTRREFYMLFPLLFLIFFFGFFPSYLTSFWVFPLETWFINFEDFTVLTFPMFFVYTKAKFPYIFGLLHRYSVFVQAIYDRISFFLLHSKFKPFLLFWYKILFYFRAICYHVHSYFGEQYFLALIILLSIILSKYYLNGLLFLFFLFFRLEFGVLRMAKFYKQNPLLFISNFPLKPEVPGRGMHKLAGNIIEGASNPMVQGLAIGLASAAIIKTLEHLDNHATIESNEKIAQLQHETSKLDIESKERVSMQQSQLASSERIRQEEIRSSERIRLAEINSQNEKPTTTFTPFWFPGKK